VLERDDVFRVDIYDERMRAALGAFFLGMDAVQTTREVPTGDYDHEQALGAAALGVTKHT